jgi:putative membrane protein
VNKYFERLHCELTTRSLKFNKGYIFRTEKTIPLDKIQDLTFKEGPLLKAFGLSILQIETAGSSASASADLSLIGIVNASQFRDKVLDQRDVVTENTSSSSAPSSDNSEDVLEVLKDIRASLERIEKSR